MYQATYHEAWNKLFEALDSSIKIRIAKKIIKILEQPQKRHLKQGANFFIDEVGQYRIVYQIFEQKNEVRFYFVGTHKDYEKWYKPFF